MYIVTLLYSPFQTKTRAVDFTHPSFCSRVLKTGGRACWLLKDNSKLLFLLIKWLWKRVKIKHSLNIDHTSHFVTPCFFVFFSPWCPFVFSPRLLIFTRQSWQKVLYYIFLQSCVSVWANDCFVVKAGWALLVVMCWKLARMFSPLSLSLRRRSAYLNARVFSPFAETRARS